MKRGRRIFLFFSATIFNLLVTAILFFALLALWGLVLAPVARMSSSSLGIPLALVLSVVGDGLIYKAVLKRHTGKLEKPGGFSSSP